MAREKVAEQQKAELLTLSDICIKKVLSNGWIVSRPDISKGDKTQFIDKFGKNPDGSLKKTPYRHHGFDAMAKIWEARFYDSPSGVDDDAIAEQEKALEAELNDWGATLAWSSDTGITAVKLWDKREDGVRVARPWMDLRTFEVLMSEEDEDGETITYSKIMKRLAVFGWQVYLGGQFHIREVHGNHPVMAGKALSIRWVEDILGRPLTAEEEVIEDGRSFMRPSAWSKLVQQMYQRGMDYQYDVEILEVLVEDAEENRRFNIRIITPWGIIKGDVFVVASDDLLEADIVTSKTMNLKPEVKTTADGDCYIVAFAQEQQEHAWTNAQLLCHFKSALWPKVELQAALTRLVEKLIANFKVGERTPGFAKKPGKVLDAVHTMRQKFQLWFRAGLPVNSSLKLMLMEADNIKAGFKPKRGRGEETRRFPMEAAVRVSLSSESDAVKSGYLPKTFKMFKPHHALVLRELGLIVSDALYVRIAKILGGADKDDHTYILYRIASSDFTSKHELGDIHIKKGDVVMIIIRTPIGYGSNGKQVASEWVPLVATKREAANAMKRYGSLPKVNLNKMPAIIDSIKYPEDTFDSTPRAMGTEYTKAEFMAAVRATRGVNKAYGDHSNIVMEAARLRCPLTHYGPEERFVDVRQKPNIVDVLAMVSINKVHIEELVEFVMRNDLALDPYMAARLSKLLKPWEEEMEEGLLKVGDDNSLFPDLVDFHQTLTGKVIEDGTIVGGYLNDELEAFLKNEELPRHKQWVKDLGIETTIVADKDMYGTPVSTVNNIPWVIKRSQELTKRHKDRHNIRGDVMSYVDFTEIGNQLEEMLVEFAHGDEDFIILLMREAWAWCVRDAKAVRGTHRAEKALDVPEFRLTNGRLVNWHIKMLQREYGISNS